MSNRNSLTPILLTGFGRSGSTAIMALLGTDPRVAFDRQYPFENRWLSYVAKFATMASRGPNAAIFDSEQLFDFGEYRFGSPPWTSAGDNAIAPSTAEWLTHLWSAVTARAASVTPGCTHYAEKAPPWLPEMLRPMVPLRVIHQVRDPRDAFISARNFARDKKIVGFGIDPGRPEDEQIRELTCRWLAHAEAERGDRGRDDAIVMRYEDWVRQPREVARRLSEFLQLELNADLPEVSAHLDSHRTSANPVSSLGRWRHEQLPAGIESIMLPQLCRFMEDYGYERPGQIRSAIEWVPHPTWKHSPDGEWNQSVHESAVVIRGGDVWMEMPVANIQASTVAEVWVCLRGQAGDHGSVYWRGPGQMFDDSRQLHVAYWPSQHWQIVRFPVGRELSWRGTIEQLRVDVFNGTIKHDATGSVRWVRLVA